MQTEDRQSLLKQEEKDKELLATKTGQKRKFTRYCFRCGEEWAQVGPVRCACGQFPECGKCVDFHLTKFHNIAMRVFKKYGQPPATAPSNSKDQEKTWSERLNLIRHDASKEWSGTFA